MSGLTTADWVALAIYLLAITFIGLWSSRHVKSSADFFMPHRFGKAMMVTFAFGTGTSSDQAVTVASQTMTQGLSAIWWQWMWLPATPFYWFIAAIMRRFRAVTTADIYKLRYNQSVALLFAVVGILSLAAKIGLLLKGVGAMVHSCTDGAIHETWAIAVVTILFVSYGMAGGLGAAIVTDFFQGILTVLFSFLLLPFVLHAVGGISGMRELVNGHNAQMLSLLVPGKIDGFFVLMYAMQALTGIVAFPFVLGVCSAGRTELDGRIGFMFGTLLKRVCTMAWSLTAMAAVAWYLQQGIDLTSIPADHIYGNVARAFLPQAMPGLLGVFLACLLASIMSSCDAIMVSSAALFTENVYRPYAAKRPDSHYIFVGRMVALVVVACGVTVAFLVPDVISALDFWFRISPMMGIMFWIGLIWRRATPAGAWAGTLTGFAAWWLASRRATAEWLATFEWPNSLQIVWRDTAEVVAVHRPWEILFYTVSAVLACVVVSMLSTPVPNDRLQRFFDLTRTPVLPDETVEAPCTMPVGVPIPKRRMLISAGGLEIPVPSLTSLGGFALGWIFVAALILLFRWIVTI